MAEEKLSIIVDVKFSKAELERAEQEVGKASESIARKLTTSLPTQGLERAATNLRTASSQLGSSVDRVFQQGAGALGPFGRALGEIAGQASQAAGGLDGLALKAGLSAESLVGLGIGVGVISALGGAIATATSQAAEFERTLIPVVIRSREMRESLGAVKGELLGLSRQTGITAGDLASGLGETLVSGVGQGAQAMQYLEVAANASLAGLGSTAEAAARLDTVLDAFNLKASEAATVAGKLFVAARVGEQDFGRFTDAVGRAAVVAGPLGIKLDDLAVTIAGITKQGVSAERASTGIAQILTRLTNEADPASKRLRALGVDLSTAAFQAHGLSGVLDEIGQKVGGDTQLLAELFGSPRLAAAAFAAVGQSATEVQKNLADMQNGAAELGDAIQARLQLPSEALNLTWQKLKGNALSVGSTFLQVAGDIVGSAPDIKLNLQPDAITDFEKRIAGAFESADIATIETAIAGFSRKVDAAFERVRGRFAGQGQPFDVSDLLTAEKLQQADPNFLASLTTKNKLAPVQDDLLATYDLVDNLNKILAQTDRQITRVGENGTLERLVQFKVDFTRPLNFAEVFEPAGIAGPLREVPVKLAIQRDSLQRDLDLALSQIEVPGFEIPFDLLPEDVLEAHKRLKAIQDSGLTRDALGPSQQAQVQQDLALIKTQIAAQREANQLLGQLDTRSTSGLDQQRAQGAETVRQLKEQIDLLELVGVRTSKIVALREALTRFKEASTSRIDQAADRQVTDTQARLLQLRAASIEKAQQLAQATGQVNLAESLGLDLVKARSEAGTAANAATLAGLREQLKGNDKALGQLGELERLLREQVAGERAVADAQRGRANRQREIDASRQLIGLQNELREGLDAELAGIDATIQGRRQAAAEAAFTGKLTTDELTKQLFALDRLEDKQERLAKLRAARGVEDEILGLTRDTATALSDQLTTLERIRELERERLIERLTQQNATPGQRNAALTGFDTQTEQQRVDLVSRSLGVTAAFLGEQALIHKALQQTRDEFRDVEVSAEHFGERVYENALKAREGIDALNLGIQAGLRDSLREFADDYAFGLQAINDQLRTLQGSTSNLLQNIGKKNALRDFAVSNLQQVQKNAADFAANKITLAIGDAFLNDDLKKILTPQASGAELHIQAARGQDAAATKMGIAVDRFAATVGQAPGQAGFGAAGAGGNAPSFGGLGESPFGPDGDAFAPQSDLPPAVADGLEQGADQVSQAGQAFGSATTAAASAFGSTVISSGNAFAAAISGFAQSLAPGISQGIAGLFTGGAGGGSFFASGGVFAQGGTFEGVPVAAYSGLSPRANRVGGVYKSRTLIEVAEVPGLTEAVVPLAGGALPVELRIRDQGNAARARERVAYVTPERDSGRGSRRETSARAADGGRGNVTVAQPITIHMGDIHVSGRASDDPRLLAREVAGHVQKGIAAALNARTDNQLFEAIREAAQGR